MTDGGAAAAPRRRGLRRTAGLLAGALALAFLAYVLVDGWSAVRERDWDPDWALLAACAAVLVVFYLASGAGYLGVLEALSERRPPRRRMLAIWALSLLGRYVPGSVVMVAGRMELARDRGVPRRVTLTAIVYEQALGVGTAAAAAAAWVLVYGDVGPSWVSWLVVALPLGLVLLHPRVMGPASSWALRRARREPLARLIPPGRVLLLAGWYLLTAGLLALGIWLFVRGLAGPEVGSVPFVGGAFLFAFAVSMLAVVVPSGLGIRDGAFALALSQHVPGGVAVALSVGSRLALTVVEVAVVGATLLAARRA
ncbi:MAG: lysylphosphatidylglycerol synthase domain-containing protein [Thermoleophilia bacterium]